jgi:integrase
VRGKRYRESSESTNRADAVRLLKARISAIARGKPVGAQVERATLGDIAEILVADYIANARSSTKRARIALKRLFQFFDVNARANTISSDRITAYKAHRQKLGAANATINNELAILRRAFTLALDAGKIAGAPRVKMLHLDNVRQGFFERDQYEAVLKHLPPHLHGLIRVAYVTGWRAQSELTTRMWKHVDFDKGWRRLEPGGGTTGEGRMFPFTDELRALFAAQREYVSRLEHAQGRIIPQVFVKPDGSAIVNFSFVWKRASIKAGVPGRLVHDFRRTAVRNLERAGVPRSAAIKLTGHKTESVYRRYAITDSAMLQDAVLKLSALHASDAAK